MKYAIGVDIGGMSLKGAIISESGEIITKFTHTVKSRNGNAEFLANLRVVLDALVRFASDNKMELKGIGIGVPGLVNSDSGIIESAVNVNVEKLDLRAGLADYGLDVFISNDANVACLAEQRIGAAKGVANVLLLTLGTGVGGGVVIDNKLFEGYQGKGVELGHMVIRMGGRLCGCGRQGCLEAYASATALMKFAKEELEKNPKSSMLDKAEGNIERVDGRIIFESEKEGDAVAKKVVKKYIKYLSEGIMNYCNIFRPELVLLGGGISNQGDYLIRKVKRYCKRFDYGYKNAPVPQIKCASLKNEAGVIGAGYLALN